MKKDYRMVNTTKLLMFCSLYRDVMQEYIKICFFLQ